MNKPNANIPFPEDSLEYGILEGMYKRYLKAIEEASDDIANATGIRTGIDTSFQVGLEEIEALAENLRRNNEFNELELGLILYSEKRDAYES